MRVHQRAAPAPCPAWGPWHGPPQEHERSLLAAPESHSSCSPFSEKCGVAAGLETGLGFASLAQLSSQQLQWCCRLCSSGVLPAVRRSASKCMFSSMQHWPSVLCCPCFTGYMASGRPLSKVTLPGCPHVSCQVHSCWPPVCGQHGVAAMTSVDWVTIPSPIVGWCRSAAQLAGQALGLVLARSSTEWPSCSAGLSPPGTAWCQAGICHDLASPAGGPNFLSGASSACCAFLSRR